MIENKIVHMITPGIDSICSYFYIKENVECAYMELVHIPVSPKYGKIEIDRLQQMDFFDWPPYIMNGIEFKEVEEHIDGFIPSRNLYLATLVDISKIPDRTIGTTISFGFTKDDRVYDSSDTFCGLVSGVLSPGVTIGSFVRHLSKTELVLWFLNECKSISTRKDKIKILLDTYSCYAGHEEECFECNACFRKSTILNEVGIETRPVKNMSFLKSRLNILKENVPNERKESIMRYVNKLAEANEDIRVLLDDFHK